MQLGWQASLELSFQYREPRTVLIRNQHEGPLQVQKALYPEGPGTCHVAVLHPPGGIAAGDSLRVHAALEDRSRALLTTPGATKRYRCDAHRARQQLHFSLAEDAVLEWLPRENILFDGSNISMALDVALTASSKYFRCTRPFGGRIVLWSEDANIDAGSGFAKSTVGLAGFTVCGTFMVAGYDVQSALLATCRQVQPPLTAARFGITRVPGVLIARYLGDSTEEVFSWFTKLWTVLRPALAEKVACAPRVWAC